MATRSEINKRYDEKRKDTRARAWQCVVYPDSAPDNWVEILHSQGIAYDISPLHDKDLLADGSGYKKPHYHVVLDFGERATAPSHKATEIFDAIGGVYPDPAKDLKLFLLKCKVKKLISAQRYLCHLDEHDPNKTKYDVKDVVSGFHELKYTERVLKAMEKDEQIIAMTEYVDEQDIYDFASFVRLAKNDHPEWMHEIINGRGGTFVNRYINGKLQANRENREKRKQELEEQKWNYNKKFYEEVID